MSRELTKRGFYINSTSMLEIQKITQRFGVYLVARHQEMFDAFKTKLAEILNKDVDDPVLKQEAVDQWRKKLAGARSDLSRLFTLSELDPGFTLYLYPDPRGKKTYGVCVTSHDDWFCKWLYEEGVVNYSWDFSQEFRGLPVDDEWRAREIMWTLLIPDPDQPRLFAFAMDLVRINSPLNELEAPDQGFTS